ncbi:MAG: response regulator transcription factor [Cyclobacteriaceae bacterium]|jgi:two-component system copper resistance phosphate regulon response regulator CusR|nr:response regulator transcription factor [Cytophagales bacterium]MCZ8328918.1 response regulator transcription factor [Cyclobacteriaceae bacterium]
MKILLVEDEPKTAEYIKIGLTENGFDVELAANGQKALQEVISKPYDLLITDIIMPGMDGRELVKEVRKTNQDIPVLMLTALGTTEEIVVGFETGADDYLVKPFEFKELLVRIKSLLKRSSRFQHEDSVLSIADLTLNLDAKTVVRGGKKIDLTAKEFGLLEYLLRNKGKTISRAELAKNVWKIDFDTGTNMVEVYVNYLRKKVDKDFTQKLIHTQFGMGYVLREEA